MTDAERALLLETSERQRWLMADPRLQQPCEREKRQKLETLEAMVRRDAVTGTAARQSR